MNRSFNLELIELFEDETDLAFDFAGPGIAHCEYCDGLLQFVDDHACPGSLAECYSALRFEEMAYGIDD